ncbi:MAG: hypothetical protein F8N15_01215 [Methanobacterium sp.]|nr:hypothetical protein [Methanobacterium sp.]
MKQHTTVAAQTWVNDPAGPYSYSVYQDFGHIHSDGQPLRRIVADCSAAGLDEVERREIVAAIQAVPPMLRALTMNIRLFEHIADQYDLADDDRASLEQAISMVRDAIAAATPADRA